MLKIDIHTHVLPKNLGDLESKYGYKGFVSLIEKSSETIDIIKNNKVFRTISSNCWDHRARIKECDKSGINIQVISTIPVMFSYWAYPKDTLDLSMFLNDHIATIVNEYPKRFIGLGTIPMQDARLAIKEMERCIRVLGLAGIQIGTNVNGMNLDDENIFPIFQAAESLGASIFIHPWDLLAPERMQKYWLSWLIGMPTEVCIAICSLIFGGVLERLPKLRVAFAHGCGSFPGLMGRINHGFNARPDLCAINNRYIPYKYIKSIYMDSLVHNASYFKFLIDNFGVDRIALGTDYPFPLGEKNPGEMIESLELNERYLERLFNGTALEWLALKKEYFI